MLEHFQQSSFRFQIIIYADEYFVIVNSILLIINFLFNKYSVLMLINFSFNKLYVLVIMIFCFEKCFFVEFLVSMFFVECLLFDVFIENLLYDYNYFTD